jgi:hypothetical protein
MVTVEANVEYVDYARGIYRLTVDGHTDSDLCTGISVLVCTLNAILQMHDVDIHTAELNPGDTVIEFNTSDDEIASAYDFAVVGIRLIADHNPDKVIIKGNYLDNEEDIY